MIVYAWLGQLGAVRYQEALCALGDGADREIRIVEGLE